MYLDAVPAPTNAFEILFVEQGIFHTCLLLWNPFYQVFNNVWPRLVSMLDI